MKRFAFKMKIKKEYAEEYKKRHDEIWPELKELLKNSGIYDYSIYLDEDTGTLFAFQKIEGDGSSQDMGENPVVRRWWDYMADIMDVNSDNSPVSIPLREVFHLD